MGLLSPSQFVACKRLAEQLIRNWLAIHESPTVGPNACRLIELHPLRAADALQLAAALEACEHNSHGFAFVTADRRLADAARQTGFSVESL
jgi:hypothetical protein